MLKKFLIGFCATGLFLTPVMVSPASATTPAVGDMNKCVTTPVLTYYNNDHNCTKLAQYQLVHGLYHANIAVDGYYGPATVRAVKGFQKWSGWLKVDGVVGPNTWGVLYHSMWG